MMRSRFLIQNVLYQPIYMNLYCTCGDGVIATSNPKKKVESCRREEAW